MTTEHDWVILDTNIWIFGLRNQPDRPACIEILRRLNRLYVRIPRQILMELRANLNTEELNDLFHLVNRYPDRIDVHWNKAKSSLIHKYRQMGCKLGDAIVAAHVEAMSVKTLVSENRHFLEEVKGLPFRVLSAKDLLQELGETR